jgi:hypothetical protein
VERSSLSSTGCVRSGWRGMDGGPWENGTLEASPVAESSREGPARVETIILSLGCLPVLEDRQRAALMAVVEHCTVHNSIRQTSEIRVELSVRSIGDAPGPRQSAGSSSW